MAKRAHIDNTFRDPLGDFTDREDILELFERYLQSPHGGDYLLAIKGNSGTGKTFLISYLSRHVCPQLKQRWHTGNLSFAQSDIPNFQNMLTVMESVLEGCVPTDIFQNYYEECKEYIRSFNEYRNAITVKVDVKAEGQSSISDVIASPQVDAQVRTRELHLRAQLSKALVEVSKSRQQPLCLFIDDFERLNDATPELVSWFFRDVLQGLSKASAHPLRIVTCGWKAPSTIAVEPFRVQLFELKDFDLVHVQEYLERYGITSATNTHPTHELVAAFYELTKGHPLVLGLAVTYFNELPSRERTAASLHTRRTLVDEKARIEFLEERLLQRLPEPFRTLLERGPILRAFDQSALRILLSANIEGIPALGTLDDRSYEQFLQYPFINRENGLDNTLMAQPTFHDLVRRVQLEALRHHHPETKEQLHLTMIDYYMQRIDIELELQKTYSANVKDSFMSAYAEWFTEIPEKAFKMLLEFFYHSLQVRELQNDVFKAWENIIEVLVDKRQRKRSGQLLEVIRQLTEEGESFLDKSSNSYGRYLVWHTRFLEQEEASWEEALVILKEAATLFENVKSQFDQAKSLNGIGFIYRKQGKWEEALTYYERALALKERIGNQIDIATSFNNIGEIYREQEKWEKALHYHERALDIYRQVGNPIFIATSLNNVGGVYKEQGKWEKALDYCEQALPLLEKVGNPIYIANVLSNLGFIYQKLGQWRKAIESRTKAFTLFERLGDGFESEAIDQMEALAVCYAKLGENKKSSACKTRAQQIRQNTQEYQ